MDGSRGGFEASVGGPSRSSERSEDIILRHLEAAEALLVSTDIGGEPQGPRSSSHTPYDPFGDPARETRSGSSRASSSKRAAVGSGEMPNPKRQVLSECTAAAERPVGLTAEVADYISTQLRVLRAEVMAEFNEAIKTRVSQDPAVHGLLRRMMAVEARRGRPGGGESAEFRRAVYGELQKQDLLLEKLEDRVLLAEVAIDHAGEESGRLENLLRGLEAGRGRLDEVASRAGKLEAAAGVNAETESPRGLAEGVLKGNAGLGDACGSSSGHSNREASARSRAGDMEGATKQRGRGYHEWAHTPRRAGSACPDQSRAGMPGEGREVHEGTRQGTDGGRASHDAGDGSYPLLQRWLAKPPESLRREDRGRHELLLSLGLDKLLARTGRVEPELPGLVPAMDRLLRARRRMRSLEQACMDEEDKLREELEN